MAVLFDWHLDPLQRLPPRNVQVSRLANSCAGAGTEMVTDQVHVYTQFYIFIYILYV